MAKPKKKSNFKTIAIIIAAVILGLIIFGIGWNSSLGEWVREAIGGAEGSEGENETIDDNDKPPVAIITADKTKTTVGDAIFFDGNESYDPGYSGNVSNKGIKIYVWDFGYTTEEGARQVETTVNGTNDHEFPEEGNYIVTLTVVDEAEQEDTAQMNISIVPKNVTITSGGSVLIGDPILGVQFNNMTEINWTLKEGATSLNLTISITGGDGRGLGEGALDVYLENPYADIIENETVEVLGQRQIDWFFGPSDLSVPGKYNLVIRVESGAAMVSASGQASYL